MPTYTLIASNTVGAGGVASVTFSSIPATYTDLVVKCSVRNVSTTNLLIMSFNGSTSNFSSRWLIGDGSSASSSNSSTTFGNLVGWIDGSNETANTFSNTELYIPNYASANFKSSSADSVYENNATTAYQSMLASLWSSTAAINSIAFSCYGGGNVAQYSTFTLYGISNA